MLIIQEPGTDCPDDNEDGGVIVFDFVEPPETVYSMGFLDIDYETTVTVVYMDADGEMEVAVYDLPLLGDNSKQTLDINLPNVKEIMVSFTRSGAITFIDFCYDPDTTPPPFMTRPPTAAPTTPPTIATAPTPRLSYCFATQHQPPLRLELLQEQSL